MIPVRTIGHTTNYTKPTDWDDTTNGRCGTLSVRVEHLRGLDHNFSTWKPSAEELQLLVAGECVELCCVGVQPPVSVGVASEAPDTSEATTARDPGSPRAG